MLLLIQCNGKIMEFSQAVDSTAAVTFLLLIYDKL